MRPVLAAALLSLALRLVLTPPRTRLELGRIGASYTAGLVLALLIGRWLGKSAWPARGRALALRLMARAVAAKAKPVLYLTDRPDFEPRSWKRILEVVGFAGGVTILVPATIQLLGAPVHIAGPLGGLLLILALWGSFLLVPYWAFARLGIRRVDPVRWMVQPVSRAYAGRLRLSNGALLVIAAGVTINLAFRAGASGDEALVHGVVAVAELAASILVVSAAAVAYYARAEKELVRGLEEDILKLGILDGRAMTDGEFLPRSVVSKSQPF